MVLSILWSIIAGALGLGMVLAGVRIVRGPRAADRVVGLDLLALLLLGALAVVSHASGQPVLLDVALVIAGSAFAATLAMASRIADDRRDHR